jgi:hypothetical protein
MAYSTIATVVVGKPLVSIETLGFEEDEVTLKTNERFLPRILVELKWFPSISEVRRNRKDLVVTLDKPDFKEIRIGKKVLWLIVGE